MLFHIGHLEYSIPCGRQDLNIGGPMKFVIFFILFLIGNFTYALDAVPGQSAVICFTGDHATDELNEKILSSDIYVKVGAQSITFKSPYSVSAPSFSNPDSTSYHTICVTITKN